MLLTEWLGIVLIVAAFEFAGIQLPSVRTWAKRRRVFLVSASALILIALVAWSMLIVSAKRPVLYDPVFSAAPPGYRLVPVDHDPFSAALPGRALSDDEFLGAAPLWEQAPLVNGTAGPSGAAPQAPPDNP